MKQITMDFDIYEKDLEKQYEMGKMVAIETINCFLNNEEYFVQHVKDSPELYEKFANLLEHHFVRKDASI